MQYESPDAFRMVDLNDRYTWHRATLQEWFSLREKLLIKQEETKTTPEMWQAYLKASFKAYRQLWKEEGLSRKKNKPPLTERHRQRLVEIIDQTYFDKYNIPSGLTKWEREFLRVSEWLEELQQKYHQGIGRHTLVGLLLEWIMSVEEDSDVARVREDRKRRFNDGVSITPEKQLKYRKNPYLPRPAELIRIYRGVLIMIAYLEKSLSRCRDNQQDNGIEHCRHLNPDTIAWRVVEFIRQIRVLGYATAIETDEAVSWSGWNNLGAESKASLALGFLSILFCASPSTIKKDISRGRLTSDYNQFHVADTYRDFLDRSPVLRAAEILERGWLYRLVDNEPTTATRRVIIFSTIY